MALVIFNTTLIYPIFYLLKGDYRALWVMLYALLGLVFYQSHQRADLGGCVGHRILKQACAVWAKTSRQREHLNPKPSKP